MGKVGKPTLEGVAKGFAVELGVLVAFEVIAEAATTHLQVSSPHADVGREDTETDKICPVLGGENLAFDRVNL